LLLKLLLSDISIHPQENPQIHLARIEIPYLYLNSGNTKDRFYTSTAWFASKQKSKGKLAV